MSDLDEGTVVGPLGRGHDPVALVSGVANEVSPAGWSVRVARMFDGPRVHVVFRRPDGAMQPGSIDFGAVDGGGSRDFLRRLVEKLAAA